MADKYMTRAQGDTSDQLHDTELDARLAAQRFANETGQVVVVYECDMLAIFSKKRSPDDRHGWQKGMLP